MIIVINKEIKFSSKKPGNKNFEVAVSSTIDPDCTSLATIV